MKKVRSFTLCISIFCMLSTALAAQPSGNWTRKEGDGSFLTVRLPYADAQDMSWRERRYLYARYADTQEPVALSNLQSGAYVFATIPSDQAGRPLEVAGGTPSRFLDEIKPWNGTDYYNPPIGTEVLQVRGIVQGDGAGNLNANQVITRGEAFALLTRVMGVTQGPAPAYADVYPEDWYYNVAAAARSLGLAAEDANFFPQRGVTRGEITVMVYRAFIALGWITPTTGQAEELTLKDAAKIPAWAQDAYLALAPRNFGIYTEEMTDQKAADGYPLYDILAEQDKGATRGEVIEFIYRAIENLPLYPTEYAIEYGFDKDMPIIDGSTSTYPYTMSLYYSLFTNPSSHPLRPDRHSKSFASYQRLISGEVDMLFASAVPSEEILALAKKEGVELELFPIAYDAMVFFTNRENSAQGLTMDQIGKIYVNNAYQNWSEIGGPTARLIPYCRNMDSGSQAQMETFFLHGKDVHPNIRRETTSVSMLSVLTDVADALVTDPPTYALGYSIFYYYHNNAIIPSGEGSPLKLLTVDGVMPTDQTIADGSYPLAGYNYIVLRSDTATDSAERRMVNFMLSEEGQSCVTSAGFGALTPVK